MCKGHICRAHLNAALSKGNKLKTNYKIKCRHKKYQQQQLEEDSA